MPTTSKQLTNTNETNNKLQFNGAYNIAVGVVAVLCWGQGAQPPLPQIFIIGSIVISFNRCYLPNDEGPVPPQIFFPRTAAALLPTKRGV